MARIIVIEDNAANMDLMIYLLRAYGHEPEAHMNGLDGAKAVHKNPPDLVLCDIQLPGLSGYEVVENLRTETNLSHIKIVAVTAMAMRGDSEKALAAGFDGYIEKPIVPENFVKQVEGFLPEDKKLSADPKLSVSDTPDTQGKNETSQNVGKILVVDDLLSQLELSTAILEHGGYSVTPALSGKEAMAKLHEEKFDLIFSDVHMPDMGGFDFFAQVRDDPALPDTPFIFISSTSVGIENHRISHELGALMFVTRPIEAEILLGQVAECLSQGNKQ